MSGIVWWERLRDISRYGQCFDRDDKVGWDKEEVETLHVVMVTCRLTHRVRVGMR